VKAPWAAIVGEAEIGAGTVTLKHLDSGDQVEVSIAGVGAHIRGKG
jgi:histidyl-tRNA synthetase